MQHAADNGHHFRTSDIQILSKEEDYFNRGTRESIMIRAFDPSLNRNEGRHELPHCYDSIIKKYIKRPSPPVPHDPSEPRLITEKRGPGRPRLQPAITEEQTRPKSVINEEQTMPKTATGQPSNHHMTTRSRATHTQGDRGMT